jgi:maltose O-acetyltransferase
MALLETMRVGATYNCLNDGLAKLKQKAFKLQHQFNNELCADIRHEILKKLDIDIADSSYITPPLEIGYGRHLSIAEYSFINSGAIFLDNGQITIGAHVMVGPRVQVYTAEHSVDTDKRIAGEETTKPVVIGDKAWIGGGAIILGGVTIGEGAIVGAGSVVTKNVSPYDRVVGNPAKSILKNRE